MAIARDNFGSWGQANGSSATFSNSFTCTGSNGILWVAVDYENTDVTISSASFNGVPMTAVFSNVIYNSARTFSMFYQVGPATGSNSLLITKSGVGTNRMAVHAISYTGASQTGQPDGSNSNLIGTAVTTKTLSITTVADNCWMVGFSLSGPNILAGSNTTIVTSQPPIVNDATRMFDTNGAQTPAGSHSVTLTQSPSDQLAMLVASFSPAAAAVVDSGSSRMLLGA